MTDEDEVEARRDRSPAFPYLGLSASVDLARKLYQVARTSEVRLAQIAPHWNTTATSGALPRYAGALQGYGLIESSGSSESRKIRITDAGKRILEDTRPGVASALKAEAALRPRMLDELFHVWGKRRPTDDIAKSALQFDFNFTAVAAKRFLAVYDEALAYVPDTGEATEPPATLEPEIVAEFAQAETAIATIDSVGEQASVREIPPAKDQRRDVFSLEEGEATITLPREMSRASFEDFSAWIELVKRRIERALQD